jgi:para-nitrobenzyl esterase
VAKAQGCVTLPGGAKVCGMTDTATVGGTSYTSPAYVGIPYAKPPVGARRWQATADSTLSGTFQATAFGPVCPQAQAPNLTNQSESCLFLNVWTPSGATSTSKLPVMVFIHGGAFVEGAGSSPLYRGTYLAASGNVVVVTLNYRLGALGFLYTGKVAGTSINGNMGLLDQQSALRWVQANIGAFGGDPAKVTLFGESAGAMSTGFHLFSVPTSRSLFRAAIMESNPISSTYRDVKRATDDGAAFLKALCDTASAGRGCPANATWLDTVSTATVLAGEAKYLKGLGPLDRIISGGLPEGLPWTPVIDNVVVTGQPLNGYAANMPAKPYVFGTNANEGTVFAAYAQDAAGGKLNSLTYGALLSRLFGPVGKFRITMYNDASGTHPYRAWNHPSVAGMDSTASALADLISDFAFHCGNQVGADSAYKANNAAGLPIYSYYFQHTPLPLEMYKGVAECGPAANQVCHAYELPYVFSTLAYADTVNGNTVAPTSTDVSLGQQMGAAWVNFATNLSAPSSGWTAYQPDGPVYAWGGSNAGQMQALPAGPACSAVWTKFPPLGKGILSAARRR